MLTFHDIMVMELAHLLPNVDVLLGLDLLLGLKLFLDGPAGQFSLEY